MLPRRWARRLTGNNADRLGIIRQLAITVIKLLQKNNFKCYGTSLQKAYSICDTPKHKKYAIIVGNEANGVRENILSLMDYNIKLPMKHDVESFNVGIASAIIMYEFLREDIFQK